MTTFWIGILIFLFGAVGYLISYGLNRGNFLTYAVSTSALLIGIFMIVFGTL